MLKFIHNDKGTVKLTAQTRRSNIMTIQAGVAIVDAEAVQSAENIRTDKRIRRCKSNLHE
jgi:hypothetical protein